MPFIQSATNLVASLPQGNKEKIILEFLLKNGVGRKNAQSWAAIEAHLKNLGIHMTQQQFQQGILKETRENDIFIGSNDHGVAKGYFLIDTIDDALMMRDWYQRRIDVERKRLDNLKYQANVKGWKI